MQFLRRPILSARLKGHELVMTILTFLAIGLTGCGLGVGIYCAKINSEQLQVETKRIEAALSNSLMRQSGGLLQAKVKTANYSLDPETVKKLSQTSWSKEISENQTAAIGRPQDTIQLATGFVDHNHQLYAATIVDGVEGGTQTLLEPLDQHFLNDLQNKAKIADVALGNNDTNHKAEFDLGVIKDYALNDPRSATVISWTVARPGDVIAIKIGLGIALCAVLLGAVLLLHNRRAIADLRKSEEAARRFADSDPLSGLPNRQAFIHILDQEFARAQIEGIGVAFLALDIKELREINDTYGHDVGDQLIIGVCERIRQLLRPGDHFARTDGDEFGVLQVDISGPADCDVLAHSIQNAFLSPFEIGGVRICVCISIGIALFGIDADNRLDLMNCADIALSLAREETRVENLGSIYFFEKNIGEAIRARRASEAELRQAIETGELFVQYQPIMHIEGKSMACVEALVRWQHPTRGVVPPDHFISLAEERGLILVLGEWVLREACRAARQWPGLRLAVNVSPIQFRQKDFANMVERVLVEENLDPRFLELELTEGVIIHDTQRAEAVIKQLRGLGVRLALDDFGTGYSSLIYLRRFAIDKIKIDRAFLDSIETREDGAVILQSMIHLGRTLGITVTAEGIETVEQHDFLQAAGAHEVQGYLFSKPVPADEISELYRANRYQEVENTRSIA